DDLSPDASANRELWESAGGKTGEILDGDALASAVHRFSRAALLVDALLGTGTRYDVQGLLRDAIAAVNRSGRPIVAVDLPSGVDATTGGILGEAIRARLTVTFGLVKTGLVLYPAASCTGRIRVVDIGIPEEFITELNPKDSLIEIEDIRPLLAPRDPSGHKGTYGHAFLIGGSEGRTGAITLSAEGALRVGTGLVTVGAPQSLISILETKLTEAMKEPLAETDEKQVAEKALHRIAELAENKSAIGLGPGIGLSRETGRVVRELVRSLRKPLVVDADALTHLAEDLNVLHEAANARILTPHPGEMARLAGKSVEAVQRERLETARQFAMGNGVVVVL
ncbi:MAG: bifunctional ADP-dependent NAD(P)H-hydrate dehydratase/NAD(P)H-hydrate epimerase, partial [Vicinamibacteria bacterium]